MRKTIISFCMMIAILFTSACSFSSAKSIKAMNDPEVGEKYKNPFSDVNESDWFSSDVEYVNENKLMSGTSDYQFSPEETTTRGMIVAILWRLDGKPDGGDNDFSDVKSDMYYYDAVSWASEQNIVSGYSDKEFGPDDNITREQLAAILFRYSSYKGYNISDKLSLNKYTDTEKISDYAVEALEWTNANGIITGISDDVLSPQGSAKRCQVASILKRFSKQFVVNNDQKSDKAPEANELKEITEDQNNSAVGSSGNNTNSKDESIGDHEAEKNMYSQIVVDNVYAKPGDEVQVSVTLNNNPGVLGMALTVYYDETNLTLQSIENGEAFQDVLDLTPSKTLNSGIRFLWDGIDIAENDIKDGTILTMNFKVNGNAQEGIYPITLKYSDGDIVDKNLASVSPQIENGYITIINK